MGIVSVTEEYVVWQHAIAPNACALEQLHGVEQKYTLQKGITLLDEFPDNAYFDMDPELPNDILLTDSLYNTSNLLVFSEALVSFLSELNMENLEFLPVKIMNHKGKFVDEKYYIFNVLNHQDCLDIEKSGAKLPRIKTGNIRKLKKLVLKEEKLDPSLDIFRVEKVPTATVVKKSLADKIDAMGFTAIDWVSLDEFDGKLY
jgi:hypothetical protein